jgi:hypothetical protein
MYKNPNNGNDVDLLSITVVKQKMNLYVTSLIDIVFTRKELLQLDATEIKFNDGYKLIQGLTENLFYLVCFAQIISYIAYHISFLEAVRNKSRLSDIFKIEWCNLHETFLNKRRDIKKALKNNELQFKQIHQHKPKAFTSFFTRTCTCQHN